jgi:hypothetical protein
MTIRIALNHVTTLPLRPAGRRRSADHSSAACAALPHAHRGLFAPGRSGPSTFSTGSRTRTATYLARVSLPGKNPVELKGRSRSGRGHDGDQPVRLLRRERNRPSNFPFSYHESASASTRSCPYLKFGGSEPPAARTAGRAPGKATPGEGHADRPTLLVAINQQLCSATSATIIRMEPGIQTCEADAAELARGSCRDSAGCWCRFCANLGIGRAVRLRLPGAARRRREIAGRTLRAAEPTSPICTPGPRSICRVRAGWDSIRLRGCWWEKATFRWPARPSLPAPRRSPASPRNARTRFRLLAHAV